jgi:hypothetical protein
MITPNKVIPLEGSALGLVGLILEKGPKPISLLGLYGAVADEFESADQFILSMDVLYLLDRIDVDEAGLVIYVK